MPAPQSAQSTEERSGSAARERRARPAGASGDDAAAPRRRAGEEARPELAAVARLRERVDELEAELERKDEQLDAVVQQYESLLQDRPDGDAGDVTWRLAGERWEGSCELEFAGCREGSRQTGDAGQADVAGDRTATGALEWLVGR